MAKLAADVMETSHQLANVGQADRADVLPAVLNGGAEIGNGSAHLKPAISPRDYDSAHANVQQYKNEMLPRAQQPSRLYQFKISKDASWPGRLCQALESALQVALQTRGFGLKDGLAAAEQ